MNFDVFVSIIAPVRNASARVEADVHALDQYARRLFRRYEIVFIDDGSTDNTTEKIESLQQSIESIQLYILNRSVGFDVATVAGLDHCIGDFVFVLNVETDPISLLETFWTAMSGGVEVVIGVRSDLARGSFRAYAGRTFYKIFRSTTGLTIPAGTATPRLFTRKVVTYITQNNDRNVMLRVLPFFSSKRIGIVEYQAHVAGNEFKEQSAINAILTGVTLLLGSSIRPLRVFTGMAMLASGLSLLYSAYVLVVGIFNRHVVKGWISLALPLAVISFFISSVLGIVAEYIYMLFQRSGNRPAYMIIAESTSSVLDIQKRINVVSATGDFAVFHED